MKSIRLFSYAALLVAGLSGAFFMYAHAGPLTFVSDLITSSIPSDNADHTMQFTTTGAVPPSGMITITPDGAFTIPAGYDYTSMSFSVWNGVSYVSRSLAATPSATDDGVTVVTGGSGSFTITLSSGAGLPAGSKVRITMSALQNAPAQGSYHIYFETKDAGGATIDAFSTLVAMVNPVTIFIPLSDVFATISNAYPSGTIAAGNPVIELSFTTDWPATCRYSTSPGVAYASMADSFPQTNANLFYVALSGFQDNTAYTYYVRCKTTQGGINTSDFPISFNLAPTPISNTSVAQAGGGGGSSGTGPYPNGSPVLYLASVTLSGFTSPGSTVEILQDGTQVLAVQAQGDGSFRADVSNIERGTYTFSVYSVDTLGRKTASYSATQSIGSATFNTINNIILPPSIAFDTNPIPLGGQAVILGAAAPASTIDISVASKAGAAQLFSASSSASGVWSLTTDKGALSAGTYTVKARTTFGLTESNDSIPLSLGVGQAPATVGGSCGNSDINGDKKVNLVDFSILLSNWGTSATNTDLNCDGTTNLADFSILLFNWTG